MFHVEQRHCDPLAEPAASIKFRISSGAAATFPRKRLTSQFSEDRYDGLRQPSRVLRLKAIHLHRQLARDTVESARRSVFTAYRLQQLEATAHARHHAVSSPGETPRHGALRNTQPEPDQQLLLAH
jgi:hypothetical protein